MDYDEKSKRNRMFKMLHDIPDNIKRKFEWDDEAVWSFTDLNIARALAKTILNLPGITAGSLITDATASIGGNTIAFAEVFEHVNSIELNPERFEMLRNNIRLVSLNEKIATYRGYLQEFIYNFDHDVVFFDPPWGRNYKDFPNGTLRLSMSGPCGDSDTVEAIINSLSGYVKYVVVKLPINYDVEYLTKEVKKSATCVHTETHDRPNTSMVKIFRMLASM